MDLLKKKLSTKSTNGSIKSIKSLSIHVKIKEIPMSKFNSKLILSTALGLTVLITTPLLAVQDTDREIAEKKESVGEYVGDAAVTTKVKAALMAERHLPASKIHVITTNNVVELSGTVNDASQKRNAENVAARVEGVQGVINKLEVRSYEREAAERNETLGEYVDDSAVTTKVKAKLKAEPNFDASDIKVITVQNNVELKGTVRTESEKKRAQDIAASVTGAKKVINHLTVR
jgi:hyperosmotically inducible protein